MTSPSSVDTAAPAPGVLASAENVLAHLQRLVAEGRFHRDSGFGRIFHPGKVSFRENVANNSLHVLVDGDRVSAHVDLVSPLRQRPQASTRYAMGRVAAHNLSGMAADLVRLFRGRQGDHRCELDCEWIGDDAYGDGDGDRGPTDLPHPDAGPWSVQLEVRVAGRLDEERLAAALASALCAHPESLRVVRCNDDASLDQVRTKFQGMSVPLEQCPPLRVLLAHAPDGDVLILNVNHAACDGFGAERIFHALARAYADPKDILPQFDFLALADLPVRPASGRMPALMRRYLGAVDGLRNALAPPAPIMPDGQNQDHGYGFHLVSVPVGTIGADVLLAGLHRAIGTWNAAHGAPGHRINVLVPVDLRPPEWFDERVGNFSVTARVSTSRRHRQGMAAAVKVVSAQITRNKRSRTGTALIAALDRTGLVPLWTKQSLVVLQPLTRNRSVDCAMLCDLGQVDGRLSFGADAGDTLEVWFSAPARDPLDLCLGTALLNGRLHLTFRYPRRLFDADAARRFAECYVAEIAEVTEVVVPGSPATDR